MVSSKEELAATIDSVFGMLTHIAKALSEKDIHPSEAFFKLAGDPAAQDKVIEVLVQTARPNVEVPLYRPELFDEDEGGSKTGC